MGDSLPPPAEFDLVDSFARLRGADAEIALGDPKTELVGVEQTVRLSQGRRRIDAAAEMSDSPTGRRLTVRVPRSRLSDGIWSLQVVHADGSVAPLAARLLVQGRRPLVLLWGAHGGKSQVPAGRPTDVKRRVAATGARVLDRALTLLPEEKAARVRQQVRTTARKVLG